MSTERRDGHTRVIGMWANAAPHGRRDIDVSCRRLVGLCQWRGNEPCHEQATHDLVPEHGTPSRMCEKHYNFLKFLEAND